MEKMWTLQGFLVWDFLLPFRNFLAQSKVRYSAPTNVIAASMVKGFQPVDLAYMQEESFNKWYTTGRPKTKVVCFGVSADDVRFIQTMTGAGAVLIPEFRGQRSIDQAKEHSDYRPRS